MIALGVSSGPERREAGDFTTALVGQFESAAVSGAAVASAVAAVETCAGLWGRGLALAAVTPRNRRTAALTPAYLEMLGRELARRGQLVSDIAVEGGHVRLTPAAQAWIVKGSSDPRTWLYSITMFGPGDTRAVWRRRDEVAHVRYGVDPRRLWEGRPPWASAALTGALLAGVERQLSGEAASASGYVMAIPDVGDKGAAADGDVDGVEDPIDSFRSDLHAAAGRTVVAPAVGGGWGAGPGAAPAHEFKPARFGINPPSSVVELRRDIERSILSCYGVGPVMFSMNAPGAGAREAWRSWYALSLAPVAEIVTAQLREDLGEPALQLDLRRARASEAVQLARGVHVLQQAGIPVDEAREIVGL